MARCHLIQMPRPSLSCAAPAAPGGSRNLQRGRTRLASEAVFTWPRWCWGYPLWGLVQWKLQNARGFYAPRAVDRPPVIVWVSLAGGRQGLQEPVL